jgi:hypothetical protein
VDLGQERGGIQGSGDPLALKQLQSFTTDEFSAPTKI